MPELAYKSKRVTVKGEAVDIQVYEREGREIVPEDSVIKLGEHFGLHSVQTEIVAYPEVVMTYGQPRDESAKRRVAGMESKYPRSTRYIARTTVQDKGGHTWGDVGSAAVDSISMSTLWAYAPEIACKRSRVRAYLLALGLKDLNADVEFPDGKGPVDSAPAQAPVQHDITAGGTTMTFDELGAKTMSFGKHGGKTLAQMLAGEDTRDYLVWISKQDIKDTQLREDIITILYLTTEQEKAKGAVESDVPF
jgi:uncharacterized protein (DUF3820 family)